MSTKQREPKIETWLRNLQNGNITNKTMVVLSYVKKHPNTDIREICTVCDLPHQTVTASLSNLMDEGVVKMVGEREIGNSVYSTLLFVNNQEERYKLKHDRIISKMAKWVKRGYNHYYPYMSDAMRDAIDNVMFPEKNS